MSLHMNAPLPDLTGATRWFNLNEGQEGFKAEALKGSPTLVHFWSVSCHTCHEIASQVQEWKKEWEPRGIKFIAVHQAKSEADLNLQKIEEDIKKMGMDQPVAADNQFKIIDAFDNQYVPAFYLFDSQGKLRHFQAGDRGYDRIINRMERLIAEESGAQS
ncbi:MAG TPA: redoxin domain-containing protein [Chloroflexia bacterium]|nr:redoxin domain-containing protein [Chloroflexia bacterium]